MYKLHICFLARVKTDGEKAQIKCVLLILERRRNYAKKISENNECCFMCSNVYFFGGMW